MRWLYHVRPASSSLTPRLDEAPYAPESLGREGFIHCSYRDTVVASARLYFAADAQLEVLRIDPRRVPVEVADTPRGPMPHVTSAIAREAIVETLSLDAMDAAPDLVGTDLSSRR